jgi:hypothetical protein
MTPPATFVVDPALRETDSEPPTPFSELSAFTRRISATRCDGKLCTSISCGDDGHLELHFEPPKDDSNAAAELGYRVVWLSGRMPDGLRAATETIKPLADSHTIALELGWNGVTELNGDLALIAVDRAGNESEASRSVHVEWSGCTSYWDDPACGVQDDRTRDGCAVLTVSGRTRSLPLWAAAAVGGALLWRKRRRNSSRV